MPRSICDRTSRSPTASVPSRTPARLPSRRPGASGAAARHRSTPAGGIDQPHRHRVETGAVEMHAHRRRMRCSGNARAPYGASAGAASNASRNAAISSSGARITTPPAVSGDRGRRAPDWVMSVAMAKNAAPAAPHPATSQTSRACSASTSSRPRPGQRPPLHHDRPAEQRGDDHPVDAEHRRERDLPGVQPQCRQPPYAHGPGWHECVGRPPRPSTAKIRQIADCTKKMQGTRPCNETRPICFRFPAAASYRA